ncbi:Eukaryotic translation initiation factor eIF-1 [Fusarium oxysporum f. sp. albedinis]|nr:Eukaryotic translation initiation factor eIF-1 [Fusarium oxysporum f. sp. albedinis]
MTPLKKTQFYCWSQCQCIGSLASQTAEVSAYPEGRRQKLSVKLETAEAAADADTTGGGIPRLGSCLGSIQMYTGEKNVGIDQLLLSLEGG